MSKHRNYTRLLLMEKTLLHWQQGKAFRHLIYYDFFYTGAFASGLIQLLHFHIFWKKGSKHEASDESRSHWLISHLSN